MNRAFELDEIEDLLDAPLENFAHQCHVASIQFVQRGIILGSRVARGWCDGVRSQHSWVVNGPDVYDPEAEIIDLTLWSYEDVDPYVWHGTIKDHPLHKPHGLGEIMVDGPHPEIEQNPVGDLIKLEGLSAEAQNFLDLIAPNGLDMRGWHTIAHEPVQGWPAKEIITKMWETQGLKVLIPIDIVGNLTDINPNGLYLDGPEGKW